MGVVANEGIRTRQRKSRREVARLVRHHEHTSPESVARRERIRRATRAGRAVLRVRDEALWSQQILDEMVSAIEEIHPGLADGPARRRAEPMDRAFDDACVRGWQPLVEGIALPDEDEGTSSRQRCADRPT